MARRKKTLASLPAQIYNLGSPAGESLDFSRAELWEGMDAPMGAKAVSIPVFLLNEAQMDYIYPPERRRALSPERIRDWLRKEKEKKEEVKDFFQWLKEWEKIDWERYHIIVKVGVYISDLKCDKQQLLSYGDSNFCTDEAKDALMNLTGPTIFLCPERIINWAQEAKIPVEIVLDKVYYHELGHAIMDTGYTPYDTVWGRTIEESCANWIAYNCFNPSEAVFVQKIIKDQPAEYQGYVWLDEPFLFLIEPRPLLSHYRYYHYYPSEWIKITRDFIRELGLYSELGMFFRNLKFFGKIFIKSWMEQKKKGFSKDDEIRWGTLAELLLTTL